MVSKGIKGIKTDAWAITLVNESESVSVDYKAIFANEIEDNDPVHFKNVIGVPQFSIPKLGYVSDFVQHPPGMYITIGIGVLLILAVFLPDLFAKKKEEENQEAAAVQTEMDAAAAENEKLKAELAQLRAEMEGKKDE